MRVHYVLLGQVVLDSSWGTTTASAGRSGIEEPRNGDREGTPISCATMNAGADDGLMPANVLLSVRAMVTAGLAKLVDDVNQYAAAM